MLNRITAALAAHPRWTALIAGGVSATGFAPLGLWPLTLIALALLLWLLESATTRRRAFGLGYLWGVGHFAIGLNWIATAFTFQAAMPAWLGWVAVLLLSIYLAVFPGLAAMAAWWGSALLSQSTRHPREGGGLSPDGSTLNRLELDSRLRGNDEGREQATGIEPNRLPLLLFFAAAWIITEWLRSWAFTGFAWNPLSAVLTSGEGGVLPQLLLPWFGTYGLTGVTVIGGVLVAHAVSPWAWQHQWQAASAQPEPTMRQQHKAEALMGFGLSVLIVVITLLPQSPLSIEQDERGTPVTIVQPNIQQDDKWDPATRVENFRRLARQSVREPNADPRLLLWPEAAVPDYLEDGYPPDWLLEPASFTRARLASLLGPDDLLLTGAVKLDPTPDGRDIRFARNSLFVLDAQRRIRGRYDKAHLVPYGEYLPARVVLEPLGLSRIAPGATDFRHGPGPRTLDLGRFGRMGVQICYEIIFSGQVVDSANRPDFIFNPSNDAWFGAWGPPQHLAQARLRAIEEGLPVVRSTPTGISAIIAPDGRVLESIPLGQAGRIDARLPLPREATLFARYGNILPLLLAVFLGLCGVAISRRRG